MRMLASAASAALVAVVAMPVCAWADNTARFNVTVTGTVPPLCNWTAGGADATWMLSGFVDSNDQIVETPRTSDIGIMSCNQPAKISLKTDNGGLKNTKDANASCAGGGNSYCVNYMATADWNDATITYTTVGATNASVTSSLSTRGGAHAVALTITPKKPASNVPLVAGDFLDTLTVSVSPTQ